MGAQLTERTPIVTRLAAAAAVALIPLWWHVTLVDPHVDNITAVFSTVAIYPSDICLLLVAAGLVNSRARWRSAVVPLLLPAAALLSVTIAIDPPLALSVALHLGLLATAWLAVTTRGVSPTWLAAALAGAGLLESILAVAQFITQQPLVPGWLGLPWVPGPDVSVGGTPVVLTADGTRLFRGFGTFPHPNVLGGYLALALVCIPLLGRAWWAAAPVLAAGLLLTFSRTGWLAACVGLSIWLIAADARRAVKAAIVAESALAVAAILTSPLGPIVDGRILPWSANVLERGSIGNRLQLDLDALAEARTHPSLGVGAGNFGLAAVRDGFQVGWGEPAPNAPLLIATELGLPGVLAGLTLVWSVVTVAARAGPASVPAVAVCSALAVLAMLDHYVWTMAPGRVMAWLPFAVAAAQLAPGRPPAKRPR